MFISVGQIVPAVDTGDNGGLARAASIVRRVVARSKEAGLEVSGRPDWAHRVVQSLTANVVANGTRLVSCLKGCRLLRCTVADGVRHRCRQLWCRMRCRNAECGTKPRSGSPRCPRRKSGQAAEAGDCLSRNPKRQLGRARMQNPN